MITTLLLIAVVLGAPNHLLPIQDPGHFLESGNTILEKLRDWDRLEARIAMGEKDFEIILDYRDNYNYARGYILGVFDSGAGSDWGNSPGHTWQQIVDLTKNT